MFDGYDLVLEDDHRRRWGCGGFREKKNNGELKVLRVPNE